MSKSIVLLSGGMDSLVCAGLCLEHNTDVYFMHLNYGQKTSARELQAFNDISSHFNIPVEKRKVIDMNFLKQIGGSSLTDDKIKVKKYGEQDLDLIPDSYVPFRNSIIISLAVSWAESLGAEKLFIGANFEDSPGYPDCRPVYYEAFNKLIQVGTKDGNISIETPVINMKKKEIVELGLKLKVPFQLSWSCYEREDLACGVCDSCTLRLKGFKMAHAHDPLKYLS